MLANATMEVAHLLTVLRECLPRVIPAKAGIQPRGRDEDRRASHEPGRLIARPLTAPLPAKRRGEGARTVVPSRPPTRWRFGRIRRELRLAVPSPRLFAGRGRVRGVGDWPQRRSLVEVR